MLGAIALRPIDDEQGGHYFSAHTMEEILTDCTVIPMKNEVIDQIHRRAVAAE